MQACVAVKNFRFGLHAFASSGRDEWVRTARQAEDLGFSTLTVADHLVDGCIAPFAALGVAAAVTSILRIGTLVLNNDVRHPVVVAREVLALDSMSGGRVELGIGAGHGFPEYESVGIRFDDASTRVSRLSEAVEVLDGLLRGREVTFSGDHYQLRGHRAWPPPTQRPRPRILVGGNARPLLRVAATHADTVGLTGTGRTKADGLTHEVPGFRSTAVDERIAFIRAASPQRDVELHALVQQVIVTDDAVGTAERFRNRAPELSVEDILTTPYLWIGTVESICDHVRAARERWGFSYFSLFQHSLGPATPIVTRLAGT
jgi:probable F420-dependent oxidoreductase